MPEPRRVPFEAAVELVRVVDEPGLVAPGDQIAGGKGVEVICVDDVGPKDPRLSEQPQRSERQPRDPDEAPELSR